MFIDPNSSGTASGCKLPYDSGQVPVGQEPLLSVAELLCPMENVENIFCKESFPHFSQEGTCGLPSL